MKRLFRSASPSAVRTFLLIFLCLVVLRWEAKASPSRIEFAADGPEQHRLDTKAAVEEAVVGLGVTLIEFEQGPTIVETLDGRAEATSALARVRVNFLEDQLQLVVSDQTGKGVYVRWIPYSSTQAPLAYEQVSQILRSTLLAMIAQEGEANVTAPPPQAEAPKESKQPKPAPERPKASLSFDATVVGTVSLQSSELPVVPGVEVGAGARWGQGRHSAVLRILGGYQGTQARSDELTLAIRQFPLFGMLGYRFSQGDWRVESLAGAGALINTLQPEDLAPEWQLEEQAPLSTGAFRLALKIERHLGAQLGAFASLRADFLLSRKRLVVVDDGTPYSLITPWTVQPSLGLGLSWGN